MTILPTAMFDRKQNVMNTLLRDILSTTTPLGKNRLKDLFIFFIIIIK